MTDDTVATAKPAEMPKVQPAPVAEPVAAPAEPEDAQQRLRDFEDKNVGVDAVRVEGKIERGIGSKFSLMSEEQRAEHAALERLVEAEQNLLRATAALAEAKAEFTAALEAADAHADQ